MKIQVCLIGGEAMPNVVGVLWHRPDVIKAMATADSGKMVDWLKNALQSIGFNPQIDLVEVPGFDVPAIKQAIAGLDENVPEFECMVNWTGGTKIMAAAAREVAIQKGWDLLYVNTQQAEILRGEGAQQSVPFNLMDMGVSAMTQIIATGQTIEDGKIDQKRLNSFAKPSEALVAAAEVILDASWEKGLRQLQKGRPAIKAELNSKMASALMAAALIEPGENNTWRLAYCSELRPMFNESDAEAAAKFIESGWLEVFVYSRLKRLFSPDDIDWHVTINRDTKGQMSEFDVLMYHQGRLLVVDTKVDTTVQKLAQQIMHICASTRRIGRLFSSWVIYIHKYEEELIREQQDKSILISQIERAKQFGGLLLFKDDLEDSGLHAKLARHMGLRESY